MNWLLPAFPKLRLRQAHEASEGVYFVMLFKRFSVFCATALAFGCFVNAPAGATPQRSPFVFYVPEWSLPGGTLNCSSGCRSTYNDDGSVEVDFGNGDSVLIMPDGTILGAP